MTFFPLTHGSRVITTWPIEMVCCDGEAVTIPGGTLATVDYIDGPHASGWIVGIIADDEGRVPAALRDSNAHNDLPPAYVEHVHSPGDAVPFFILSTPITGA